MLSPPNDGESLVYNWLVMHDFASFDEMELCRAGIRDVYDYSFACRPCWNKNVSWFHFSPREDVLRRKNSFGMPCHISHHELHCVD